MRNSAVQANTNMNFPPIVKAWIQLIALALSAGTGVGVTAFLGGCNPWVAAISGLGAAGTNVYHALAASPREKADTMPPFDTK